MERFDDPHVVDSRVEVMLGQGLELAAAEAGDAQGGHAVGVGPLDGSENVGAVARARDRQQDVAGRGQVLQLLDEDPVVSLVVAPCHDPGGVVGQAENLEPFLVLEVAQGTLGQVFAEVRGTGTRPAVADDEDEAPGVIRVLDDLAHVLELLEVERLDLAADAIQIILGAQRPSQHIEDLRDSCVVEIDSRQPLPY